MCHLLKFSFIFDANNKLASLIVTQSQMQRVAKQEKTPENEIVLVVALLA